MPANDKHQSENPGLNGLPIGGFPVTPDDNNELTEHVKCLIPGADGDIRVITRDGSDVTLPACKAGVQYWVYAKQLMATSTTATGIVGLY